MRCRDSDDPRSDLRLNDGRRRAGGVVRYRSPPWLRVEHAGLGRPAVVDLDKSPWYLNLNHVNEKINYGMDLSGRRLSWQRIATDPDDPTPVHILRTIRSSASRPVEAA